MDKHRWMITDRLRPLFAEIGRPLLIWHLVLGLSLSPITMIRTGWAEFSILLLIFGVRLETASILGVLFFFSMVSFIPVILFLVWSLPGAGRQGVPKRSIGALCLLIAYHPARLYIEDIFTSENPLGDVESIHEQFPIVWAFKHFDTPLLLGLMVWAVLRHQTAKPEEKTLFNWFLFLCALWAVSALNDASLGFLLQLFPLGG